MKVTILLLDDSRRGWEPIAGNYCETIWLRTWDGFDKVRQIMLGVMDEILFFDRIRQQRRPA